MGLMTLLGYLVGGRTAILALAVHPRAWLVGLILVFSAGLAREYDGEDLLRDPWYLLIPVAASLGSSFLLYCFLYGFWALDRSAAPGFWAGYRFFLGLFWLTAPLAWLYAVPYERFLSPLHAVYANLATLTLVSVWRVALMVRVAVVLFGLKPPTAFVRVVAYADAVALAAMFFVPFPLIEIMGGVRLTEEENAVRSATRNVAFLGGCSFPVWLGCALGTLGQRRPQWQAAWPPPVVAPAPVRWPLRVLVAASLALGAAALPWTQPEQQLRRRVEVAFREGRLADGLTLMSAHAPEDFPPHWSPPPRFLRGEPMSLLFDVWEVLLRDEPAPWVRRHYLDQLGQYLRHRYWDVEPVARLLNELPEGRALLEDIGRDSYGQREWLLDLLEPSLRPELRRPKKTR